jgi:hypothetical protein
MMKAVATSFVASVCFLLAVGVAVAQQASDARAGGAGQVGVSHKKAATSKPPKTGVPGAREVSRANLPCPRARWTDDPVCSLAPGEHTATTPSVQNTPAANRNGGLKWQPTGDDSVSLGVDWRASNDPIHPGYDSIPMLDSVKRNIPGAEVSSPDTRVGLGLT